MDRRGELPPVAVRVRHEEPEGGVAQPVEQAPQRACRQPALAPEPRIVVEGPHPGVQQHEAPDARGPMEDERKTDGTT